MNRRALVRFGVHELDLDARELRRNGRLIRLTPQALRLLAVLTETPGTVVSRERLRAALWSEDTHVDFDRSLNSAIRKLRAALDDEAERPRYVQTLPGRGYRFIAPVQRVEIEPDAGPIAPTSAAATLAASSVRRFALAAACLVFALIAVVGVVRMWPALSSPSSSPSLSSSPIAIGVRLVDAPAPNGDRLLQDIRAQLRRLDPRRLVVIDNEASQGCHEVLVSTGARGSPTSTRVSVQLLDTCRQEQLWADIATSDERARIVRAIGRAVVDRLLDGDPVARVIAATTSDRAIDAYRRGKIASDGDQVTQLSTSVDAFSAAVQIDLDFAPAWAALARARASRAMLDGRDLQEFERARDEATRALDIDDRLADAHLALGQVRFSLDNDPTGAEIAMRRAKALGASAARDQHWLAWMLIATGRDPDALRVLDDLIAREPGNPLPHAWRGFALHAMRRYDEELVELRRAVSLDDRSWEAVLHLGLGYSRRAQYDLALPTLRRAVALSDTSAVCLSWLGRVSADAGDVAAAQSIVAQLRAMGSTRPLSPSLADSVSYHIEARRRLTAPTGSS